jgi:cell division septum initiation protein DivIVA
MKAVEVVYRSGKPSAEIESLKECNKILKDHIDFLRKKIDEKDSIIEIYSETIIKMEEMLRSDKQNSEMFKFFLN